MSGTTWVYIMLGIYIIYCFYWGLKGYFSEKTSAGYAIAGRSIPFIAFLMAATAASFSGWTFIGHPGLIWRDGLAYAFASFYVLTIPITGTFFSKRTWLLGKRYGFVTPGDMYAYYYNNEFLRFLVVLTAVLYSIFYSAVQLMAAGALFNVIAGVPTAYGAIFLAFIVWFYVCTGGLKASTWVGVIQFVLLVGGIIILGFFVMRAPEFGGWFLERDNFTPADPLTTPEHIVPLWYFTPFYSILRAVTWEWLPGGAKLWGVIAMGASLVILFFLPWLDRSPAKSIRYKGILSKVAIAIFVVTFIALAALGMLPSTPGRTLAAQVFTALYFAFFLLMPFYTKMEKTKPVPERVTS